MLQRRRTETQPVGVADPFCLEEVMLREEKRREERGATLPLTAHRCGLRLCGEQRWRRGGGGGARGVGARRGLTPRDRAVPHKELNVWCCLKDAGRWEWDACLFLDKCFLTQGFFSLFCFPIKVILALPLRKKSTLLFGFIDIALLDATRVSDMKMLDAETPCYSGHVLLTAKCVTHLRPSLSPVFHLLLPSGDFHSYNRVCDHSWFIAEVYVVFFFLLNQSTCLFGV